MYKYNKIYIEVKMKTLVSAMALHQAKPIEAVAASISVPVEQTETLITTSVPSLLGKLTGMDIPTNHMTKLVCHDPWVSFIVTVITIIAGSLESAYSLNWGAREIWGQDLGTFMISRPI